MIPPKQFTAKLEDKIVFNDKFTQYNFELIEPYTMEFYAGQYVSIKVNEQGLRRSYSISSSPAITHGFELMVDNTPNGVGTNFLRNLQFGDQIELLVPLGQFILADNSKEEAVVMVATGSGITPFRSMVLDLLQVKQDQRPIHLHWGIRDADHLIWLDEFAQLEDAFSNFRFHPVVSRPQAEWNLCRGRVTDCFSMHELVPNAGYYMCGGKPMIISMMELLQKRGVAPESLHHEKFF
jgi:NAD(P)H-flavin reductase